MALNTVLAALGAVIPLTSAIPTSSLADANTTCNRTTIIAAADAYIAAQTAGRIEPLRDFLSEKWTYMENNKAINATDGVLIKPLKIDHVRTNTDLTDCATYTELISASGPYVIGTQIRHDESGKVASIDSIASTTNSWLFNAQKTLDWVLKEKWDEIPEGKRDNREYMKAIGDAYLDVFSNSTAASLIPWGIPCDRLEGSMYTGKGLPNDTCTSGGAKINSNQLPNINRRYVIDEKMGSVSVFCLWQHMMMAADSHEFRFENGKLRYVHTMTVCGGKACRL
ncbi:hypothetical protein GQ53DRAFT_837538 [Thozetella sp. PMI_491]|nr:hypothetical protein GQ53DRAFT_837538 [Thozetella sp. PMI_491]